MVTLQPLRTPVGDASQVASARDLAADLARQWGCPGQQVSQIELVATELAQNLHRHAVGGELLVLPPELHLPGEPELTLLAVDRGPGVEHFESCLTDGFSTTGTMGTGLGAVQRLASRFDAISEPGRGTVVAAWFTMASVPRVRPAFDVGAVGFPVFPEVVNGDVCAVALSGSRIVVQLADGLGHGELAHDAGVAAAREFAAVVNSDPGALLGRVSTRISATRGAAITVAALELDAARSGGTLVSAGLGNVSLMIVGPDGSTRRVGTSYGTAGFGRDRVPSEQRTPFPAGGTLVLHSDGLTSRWTLDGRAALLRHGATLVAAALWRDHGRASDDSMIVVVKARQNGAST